MAQRFVEVTPLPFLPTSPGTGGPHAVQMLESNDS
jgi:hypothetical protein